VSSHIITSYVLPLTYAHEASRAGVIKGFALVPGIGPSPRSTARSLNRHRPLLFVLGYGTATLSRAVGVHP
jgi:hypothetical protein